MEQILSYELAPVPTSMFEEKTRDLRFAKSKSILKNKLQVEQSACATGQPDAIVTDGYAILWVVHWPSKGSVQDLVTNFLKYVKGKLKGGTRVHLIFATVNTSLKLCLSSPLPPQQVALTVTKNKTQLIDMICDELVSTVELSNLPNSLVVTGKTPILQRYVMDCKS